MRPLIAAIHLIGRMRLLMQLSTHYENYGAKRTSLS